MNNIRYIPFLVLLMFLWISPAVGIEQAEAIRYQERLEKWNDYLMSKEFVKDEIIVELADVSAFKSLDSILSQGFEIKDIFYSRPVFIFGVKGMTVAEGLARMEGVSGIEGVYPNLIRNIAFTPNDPLFIRQENLLPVKAKEGWDITTGSDQVKIAIIDTGMDIEHPEFEGRVVWKENFFDPETKGASNVFDDSGHGTGVAGIIGAKGNNGIGIAGVHWNVKFMIFRSCGGADLQCTIANEIKAIDSAVAHGADVINLSLGGVGTNSLEKKAIQDAYNAGVVIVAAAGNESPGKLYVSSGNEAQDNANLYYPAAFPEVIGVAALDNKSNSITEPQLLTRAEFSNYGEDIVSICAVGTGVQTTTPFREKSEVPYAIYSTRNYARLTGTSFACPQVAGAAGLVLSRYPNFSPLEVKVILEQSALSLKGPDADFNGVDDYLGHGVLDIQSSLNGGVNQSSIFENEYFKIGITSSPIFNNDFYVVVKCKIGCDQPPNVSYFIQANSVNAALKMEPLPGNPSTYLGRFTSDVSTSTVTFQVSGIVDGAGVSPFTFIYTITN